MMDNQYELRDVWALTGRPIPEYTVTYESDYCTHPMEGVWTPLSLHSYLQANIQSGDEIDILTPELWIHRDKGGCPITTYHLKGITNGRTNI